MKTVFYLILIFCTTLDTLRVFRLKIW